MLIMQVYFMAYRPVYLAIAIEMYKISIETECQKALIYKALSRSQALRAAT